MISLDQPKEFFVPLVPCVKFRLILRDHPDDLNSRRPCMLKFSPVLQFQ